MKVALTVGKREKWLESRNFSFSNSVFYLFKELSAIFIKLKIVLCKLFHLGKELTVGKKERWLKSRNFSYSNNVFYLFKELSAIFIKLKIVLCKLFHFGKELKYYKHNSSHVTVIAQIFKSNTVHWLGLWNVWPRHTSTKCKVFPVKINPEPQGDKYYNLSINPLLHRYSFWSFNNRQLLKT